MDADPALNPDPDPSFNKQNNSEKKNIIVGNLASGKPLKKIAGSRSISGAGSRSVIQNYGSTDSDPNQNGRYL